MKTKIQIKSTFGSVLFELKKEDNTIKDTLLEALKSGADLSGADLSGADLYGADLRGADLYGADLREADLREAGLRGANLSGADLRGANLYGANLYGVNLYGADLREADLREADLREAGLSGANLRGANLRGANLYGADNDKITIKKAIVISGLYQYIVIAFISEQDEKWLKLGCFTRKLEDWENDFWNNDKEFPNDNSEKSNLRLLAFETAKKWFELIEKSNDNEK